MGESYEQGTPKRRCEKRGHKWRIERRRGYEDGHPDFDFWHFRCAGHALEQEREVCRRCKVATIWTTVDEHCVNSLSLSGHWMSELRRNKVVWL